MTAWTTWGLSQFSEGDRIIVGLTATPWRLSKRESMGDIFTSLVAAPMPVQLMEMGRLVKPVYYGVVKPDLKGVRTVGGDFNAGDLDRICNDAEVIEAAVREWKRIAFGRRTIAFAVGVPHAHAIAQAFDDADIPAAAVDGSMPKRQRQEIYRQLATGELLLVASCEALAEGFDVPEVEAVLLARPSKSKAKYFQQLGRGLRVAPDKTDCVVLDQAGMVKRFGFVEDLKRVTLSKSKDADRGDAPVKECPECGAILYAFEMRCGCGYEFPPAEKVRPIAQLKRLVPAADKRKFEFYRQHLKVAWERRYAPVWAANRYRDKFRVFPPRDWALGAVFGGKPTERDRATYLAHLQQCSARLNKDTEWLSAAYRAEFGENPKVSLLS
ncbi:putative helicase [Geitlerinema sp. FC II]|nr:putative helicase [Geitlerinema sp. FC II]